MDSSAMIHEYEVSRAPQLAHHADEIRGSIVLKTAPYPSGVIGK